MAGRTEPGTYNLTLVGTGRGGETAAHLKGNESCLPTNAKRRISCHARAAPFQD
jgi:hypothetical protein